MAATAGAHVSGDEPGRRVMGAAGLQLHALAEYCRAGWLAEQGGAFDCPASEGDLCTVGDL